MDFNTESRPERENKPSQEPAQRRRESSDDISSTEFNYRDPINSFVEVTRTIALEPVGFFRGMARGGDYINPLIYALVCTEVFALAIGFSGLVGSLFRADQGLLGALLSLVFYVLLLPVVAGASLFIGGGIYHLAAYFVVKPATSGFEATYRVLAYSAVSILPLAALALVFWIPVVGDILYIIASLAVTGYFLFLAVVGWREAHETTTGRAVLIMIIPSAVSFLIYLLLLIIGIGAFFFFSR